VGIGVIGGFLGSLGREGLGCLAGLRLITGNIVLLMLLCRVSLNSIMAI